MTSVQELKNEHPYLEDIQEYVDFYFPKDGGDPIVTLDGDFIAKDLIKVLKAMKPRVEELAMLDIGEATAKPVAEGTFYGTSRSSHGYVYQSSDFPDDEEMAPSYPIGQYVSGNPVYYDIQFVQNEQTSIERGETRSSFYAPTEHVPIVAGTLIGTVYLGNDAIQTFAVSESGVFSFTDIEEPEVKVVGGDLDLVTGEISIDWNEIPYQDNHLVIHYEYHMSRIDFSTG